MPLLDADSLLTDEERIANRQRRRRRWVWIGIILSLLVAVALGMRPAVGAAKAWQARRQAVQAFRFLEAGKIAEAREAATSAYTLRPTEPQALRAVAAYLARSGAAQALEFWDQVRTLAPAMLTREDRRQEAALALALGDGQRADRAVAELLATPDAISALDLLLAAQAAARRAAFSEAISDLKKILEAPDRPAGNLTPNSGEQLRAAVLLLSLPADARDPSTTQLAWTSLGKLAHGSDATSLDTLVLLANHYLRQSSPVESEKLALLTGWKETALATALTAHPLAHAAQRLLALDLQAHADPHAATAADLIERGIALCRNGDAETRLALGAWLLSKGEPARVLAEIPLEQAAATKELFLQRLDALAALGRWEDIRTLLRGQRYPLEASTEEMYLARCAMQLGETTRAENNWRHALELAGDDVSKLFAVGEYAEKNGALDAAAAAYQQTVQLAPRFRAAQNARLRLAQSRGDTAAILAILKEMQTLWPDDPAVANDATYLSLLLRQIDPSTAEATANRLLAREPASLPHHVLLALARLRGPHPETALAAFANLHVEAAAASPSALAVHAAALQAAGFTEVARQEAATLDPKRLSPEERALLPAAAP